MRVCSESEDMFPVFEDSMLNNLNMIVLRYDITGCFSLLSLVYYFYESYKLLIIQDDMREVKS